MSTLRCPHCGHVLPVTVTVTTKDRTEADWLRLAQRHMPKPVNAIAGPQTQPPRGVR